ncbi:MAG: S24/S26 family peptidase [Lachnospiraceae bacterium]|nr:S24/S26 family peptidase [Lachnospiraceae bacterium]
MDLSGKNPEEVLRSGRPIEISPRGYSMYPLLVPGRDKVVVVPVTMKRPRNHDIVVFRREGSILVIHRIVKIRRSGDGGREFYIVGDNQKELEGPVRESQICGTVVRINRKGKKIKTDDPLYRILVSVWGFLRPVRPVISRSVAGLKRSVKKFRRRK